MVRIAGIHIFACLDHVSKVPRRQIPFPPAATSILEEGFSVFFFFYPLKIKVVDSFSRAEEAEGCCSVVLEANLQILSWPGSLLLN